MEYSIPDCFMLGLLLGLCYAPVYEALRIVRLILRHKAVVFLCDVVFFVLAAQGVFRLSLVLGNYIRGYTIAGFGTGIFAYIVTVGRLVNAAEAGAAILWRKSIGRLIDRISRFTKKELSAIAQFFGNSFGKIADFSSRTGKTLKQHLIFKGKVGYNKKTDIKDNRGSVSHNVIQAQVRRSP